MRANLRVGGPDGFAHANFADAGIHRRQHDVHNAHAADQQGKYGNEQQHGGQGVRGFGGDREKLSQVVHLVHRFGAVPRLQHIMNFFGRPRDFGRVRHGKEQLFHGVAGGKEARHRIGNQHGVIGNFRLAKGVNPFLEGANYGEGQAAEFDLLPDGCIL